MQRRNSPHNFSHETSPHIYRRVSLPRISELCNRIWLKPSHGLLVITAISRTHLQLTTLIIMDVWKVKTSHRTSCFFSFFELLENFAILAVFSFLSKSAHIFSLTNVGYVSSYKPPSTQTLLEQRKNAIKPEIPTKSEQKERCDDDWWWRTRL